MNYYQTKIYSARSNELIQISDVYSESKILHAFLREEIDEIGDRIDNFDEFASYLGDQPYEEGQAFDDKTCRWDFNKDHLTQWIENLIQFGCFENGLINAYIVEKEVKGFIPKNPQSVFTVQFFNIGRNPELFTFLSRSGAIEKIDALIHVIANLDQSKKLPKTTYIFDMKTDVWKTPDGRFQIRLYETPLAS